MEKIKCAAIKISPCFDEHSIFCKYYTGERHADIWEYLSKNNITKDSPFVINYTEGFMTSEDRFVDRLEAKKIAVAANQLIVPIEDTYPELYSEDVW